MLARNCRAKFRQRYHTKKSQVAFYKVVDLSLINFESKVAFYRTSKKQPQQSR